MTDYTFFLHTQPTNIPNFEITPFGTRAAALSHAEGLLKTQPRYEFVEIMDLDEWVGRVDQSPLFPCGAQT